MNKLNLNIDLFVVCRLFLCKTMTSSSSCCTMYGDGDQNNLGLNFLYYLSKMLGEENNHESTSSVKPEFFMFFHQQERIMETGVQVCQDNEYCWGSRTEQGDIEAVEALMSMSCSWKSDARRYTELRPLTPASDMSEESEDSLLSSSKDFHALPLFVSNNWCN